MSAVRQRLATALRLANVESFRLEAEVLLARALGQSRSWVLAHGDDLVPPFARAWLAEAERRRVAGEPLAYVIGEREFYGRPFVVDSRVLVPRPETEGLVEAILRQRSGATRMADVGTGSGALAITLAVELPNTRVHALDASSDALAVARLNAHRHGVANRVAFHPSDLLAALPEPVDVIVANLPYLSDRRLATLPPDVRVEPPLALAGGADGLDLYRRLFADLSARRSNLLRPGGLVAIEIDDDQATAARALAVAALPDAEVTILPDLSGRDRLLVAALPAADAMDVPNPAEHDRITKATRSPDDD